LSGETEFQPDLQENINRIKDTLGDSSDLLIREFAVKGKKASTKLAVIFICGLSDESKIDDISLELNDLIKNDESQKALEAHSGKDQLAEACFERFKALFLCNSKAEEGSDYDTLYDQILSGNTVILVDGYQKFLILNTYGPKGRSVTEPTTQTIIRGPKDAFTENFQTNISLLRRRIKDKSFKLEIFKLGSITKTTVAVIYLDQLAKPEIIGEVRSRLNQLKVDAVLDSGYIEDLTKDDPYSIFPTTLNSEKPDSVVANLLDGKIAIIVDGSPYVLTVPAFFMDFMQVSEDYYHHFMIGTFTRIIRQIAFFLTLTVPSIYIALTTFHHEMIPPTLLISIAAQREGVPFPAFVEAMLMELTFELLREAGIRMPRAIGSAISIVGALVLGQAAVQAGIISAVMVIIVSITAIASSAIPSYPLGNAIRVIRFLLMMLAASFGLYGIYAGLIALTFHLCKLKSFGVPYMTPLAPQTKGIKDSFLRFPLWSLRYRPSATSKDSSPKINMRGPVKSGKKEDRELY